MALTQQQKGPQKTGADFPELPVIFDSNRPGDAERQQKLADWWFTVRQTIQRELDKKVDKTGS